MLQNIFEYDSSYLPSRPIDFRKTVDGLAIFLKERFTLDLFDNDIFLFCKHNRIRLKALSCDENEVVVHYKRLGRAGAKFQWPKALGKGRHLSVMQLRLLVKGLSIDPPKEFGDIAAEISLKKHQNTSMRPRTGFYPYGNNEKSYLLKRLIVHIDETVIQILKE